MPILDITLVINKSQISFFFKFIFLSSFYLAHIKDPDASVWYKFNDEVVQKQEGDKFNLGIEEGLEGDYFSKISKKKKN